MEEQSPVPPEHEQEQETPAPPSWGGYTDTGGRNIGAFAVLVGFLLIVVFFLPWVGSYWAGDQSGYDGLKEASGSDNTLGNFLLDFVTGSTVLAGLGSVIFGLGLVLQSSREEYGDAFISWASTSIGGMVVWAAFYPCLLWASFLLADSTSFMKIGLWLSLLGAVPLAIISLRGVFYAEPYSREGGWTPSLSGYGGAFAVVLGLILLVAFFLPWVEGESAWDAATDDLGGGSNLLGELLYRLILSSTALAGLGSLVFGWRLATRAGSNAAYKAWAATSIGGMSALAIMLPFITWSSALMGEYTGDLGLGFWITLLAAILLAVAGLLGLIDAFATQREEV